MLLSMNVKPYLQAKSWRFFLYRRLSRLITCQLNLPDSSTITLEDKYQVASFNDVFCHPFYWQVFNFIEQVPTLVIDGGAHCGHFTILTDVCLRAKFEEVNTHYVLVEPNPRLASAIDKNLRGAGLEGRFELKKGLLGAKRGTGTIWIDSRNFLTSSLSSSGDAKPYVMPYVNLAEVVAARRVDLMKLDIEGGEFDFVRDNLDVLSRVNLLFLELHQEDVKLHHELLNSLASVGLDQAAAPIKANGQILMIFKRQ
jgi:FkbM family methyltransferase